jgi:mRNA-degrading endonuclease YafQ of YafQ-DinJ toxin-antitoxin module
MAGSIAEAIRKYINAISQVLNEAPPATPIQIGITMGSKFEESLKQNEIIFPDLREKLKKFIEVKKSDPLNGRYGKHDSPFAKGTPLAGYMHCHLRDDAILIYTMKNRSINLLLICNHAAIDGSKKATKVAKILAAA